jgi:VanZ family protein
MRKILLWLATFGWAYLIFYLTSIPNFKISPDSWTNSLISNASHFAFFGVQAVLLHLSLRASQSHVSPTLAIIMTSFYGILDELRQWNIPGRTTDPWDWLLDTLGAIVFLAILRKYYLSRGKLV